MDRSAPLCWGQRYVWLNHYQLPEQARHELNFTISIGPAQGSTIDSLRLALDFLVRRHEGLRTTSHFSGAGPVQRVHPPRRLPVACYDTADHSPAELTELINEITTAGFALDEEWPIRACIISAGSVPRRVILVGHHTTLDDWSLQALKREADELHYSIMARRRAALPAVRHHPVDLARYEASAPAAQVHRRSLQYCDRGLSRLPADLFGSRRDNDRGRTGPAALSASLSSPAALVAARELATRHSVWPSIVYTAAYTALLAAYTGSSTVYYRTYAGNRDGRHADVLTCLFQPVLVYVDRAGNLPFAEIIRRTAAQCGAALENSTGAYDEILETVARRSAARGMGIRIAADINCLRYPEKVRGGSRTIFSWNPQPWSWALLGDDAYLRVSEWQDCVVATVNAARAVLPEPDAERFLRGFEALLVTAADGADELFAPDVARLAGFTPAPVPASTATVDNTVVDLERIADCLREYPGVRAAKVVTEPAAEPGGDRRLVAYLVADGPAVTPGLLRAHLLGRAYDVERVCCPHRFVLCEQLPAGHPVPATATGCPATGWPAPEVAPETEAERMLAAAVRAANHLDALSVARSYVEVGGRVLNIPQVLQQLRDNGWAGPTLMEMASARPLRGIATRLHPTELLQEVGHEPTGTTVRA